MRESGNKPARRRGRTQIAAALAAMGMFAGGASAARPSWHSGYRGPDSQGIYGRWLPGPHCRDYATFGCVKFEAVAPRACSYFQIVANEMRGGAVVDTLLDNRLNVPARTPVIFELDADRGGVRLSTPTLTCT